MTANPLRSDSRDQRRRVRTAVRVAGVVVVFATLVVGVAFSSTSAGAAGEDHTYNPSFVGAPYFAPGQPYAQNFPDPDVVWDPTTQKYYAFSTTTGGVYVPVMWSTDLVTWTARTTHSIMNPNFQFHDALPDPSPSVNTWTSGSSTFPDELWAPAVAKLSGNGATAWFMFYALRMNDFGTHCIYYASSQTPDGPYTMPLPMFCSDTPLGVIDPEVFSDPSTGKTWLLWQDQGEPGQYWATIWAREIVETGPQTVDWAPGSLPVYLLQAGGGWEHGVTENPSLIRLSDGVPTLFYSGGWWDTDGYSLGMAKCGPLQFSWTPICTRVGSGQLMSARQGMRGIGGSSVFRGAGGAVYVANHYWSEGLNTTYPGNQRRLVVDRLYETPGGLAFSHEPGPVGVAASSGYVSVGPTRVLDTRDGTGTTWTRALESGEVFTLDLSGQTTATTTAVTLNVAVDGAAGPGYLTAYPCGDPPVAASLNYAAGAVVGNSVTVRLNAERTVCFYAQTSTHLIVDLQGRYDSAMSTGVIPVTPARVLDTRPSATVPAGGVIDVPIVGHAGVPVGATAAVIRIAADGATGPGYLTAWQCGGTHPVVANVNYGIKWPSGNEAIVPLSQAGSICIYSQYRADVIVDVFGYVGASGQHLSITTPVRVLDSRTSIGLVNGGQDVPVQVTGTGKAAVGSTAVEVNIAATDVRAPGWVSVFPCSTPPSPGSETAVLNLMTGQTKAAHVVVPVGTVGLGAGQICLRAQNATHLVVDLSGGYS